MTVFVCTSEDPSAPVLSGQVGALVALLDAVLVNGYGTHPGLGWTIAFTSADQRVYRMPVGTTSARFLRVDDRNAQYGIVNGYDSMTGMDVGIGGFPPIATPRYWRKSSTTNATVRPWAIYSDGAFLNLFFKWSGTADFSYHHHIFGDVVPIHDAPGQVSVLTASSTINESQPTGTSDLNQLNTIAGGARNHAIPRADGQLLDFNWRASTDRAAGAAIGEGYLSNIGASDVTGADFYASDLYAAVLDQQSAGGGWVLGQIPGVLAPWSIINPTRNGEQLNGIAGAPGRTFRLQALASSTSAASNSAVPIDITGPWR